MRYIYIFFIFLNLLTSINLINTMISKKNREKFIFIFLELLEVFKFGFLFFSFYSDYISTLYFFKWIVFIEFLTIPCLLVWSNIFNLERKKKKYLYTFFFLLTAFYIVVMNSQAIRIVKFPGIGYIISMVGIPYYYDVFILMMIFISIFVCILNYKKTIHVKYMILEIIVAFICIIESLLFIFNRQIFIYQTAGELALNLYLIYLIEKPKQRAKE